MKRVSFKRQMNNHIGRIVGLCILCTMAFPLSASVLTNSNAGVSTNSKAGGTLCFSADSCTGIIGSNQYGFALASANASLKVSPSGISLFADIGANSASFTGPVGYPRLTDLFATASATVFYNDQAIIFGPSQGFLDVVVTTLIDWENDANGSASLAIGGMFVWVAPRQPVGQTTLHVPFQSGQPINISSFLTAQATDFQPNTLGGQQYVTIGIGTSRFTLFDLGGQRISDFSYLSMSRRSASICRWGLDRAEPSTFLLSITGLIAVLCYGQKIVTDKAR